uniref:Tetraspanin n=2 Tax=Monodelphis domestica TaxID=13616 RepID=F7G2V8_MONDO
MLILLIGLWTKDYIQDFFSPFVERSSRLAYVTLIIPGGIFVALTFYSCFATSRTSSCLLKLYALFLIILIAVELVLFSVVVGRKKEIMESMRETLQRTVKKYQPRDQTRSRALDGFQRRFKCCGADGVADYDTTQYFQEASFFYPESCCVVIGCYFNERKDKGHQHKEGCFAVFENLIKSLVAKMSNFCLGLCCFQAVGILLAGFLSFAIPSAQYEIV